MEDITSKVNNLSQRAIIYGKSFSKNLDYSERSLKDIEEILDYYYKGLKGSFIRNIFRKKRKNQLTLRFGQWLLFGECTLETLCAKIISIDVSGYMRMDLDQDLSSILK